MKIFISETKQIDFDQVLNLYKTNQWSAAGKPKALQNALFNSHSLVTAWHEDKLVGLGNALSDGYLVVYYPHLLVLPEYQGKGIGHLIMKKLQEIYKDYHMQMLTADENAIAFYKKIGFVKAGNTTAMWIYDGKEH